MLCYHNLASSLWFGILLRRMHLLALLLISSVINRRKKRNHNLFPRHFSIVFEPAILHSKPCQGIPATSSILERLNDRPVNSLRRPLLPKMESLATGSVRAQRTSHGAGQLVNPSSSCQVLPCRPSSAQLCCVSFSRVGSVGDSQPLRRLVFKTWQLSFQCQLLAFRGQVLHGRGGMHWVVLCFAVSWFWSGDRDGAL